MFAAPMWRSWATATKIGAQLHVCLVEDYLQKFMFVVDKDMVEAHGEDILS